MLYLHLSDPVAVKRVLPPDNPKTRKNVIYRKVLFVGVYKIEKLYTNFLIITVSKLKRLYHFRSLFEAIDKRQGGK